MENTTLTARLDRLPWGKFHTVVILALSLGWALDAFETNVIGSVLGQVRDLWHLSATEGSALVSSWVLGIFVGAILFGHLADRTGRKKMFIFTLFWYAGFSVATAFSWNLPSLLIFRFLAALGVGGEYSAVTAAMVEFIPQRHRGKASALVLAAFPVGAIVSALLAGFFLNNFPPAIGWRLGFGAGALLALFGIWVRYAIPESPRWLSVNGRNDEAEKIVRRVEESLGMSAGSESSGTALQPEPASVTRSGWGAQVGELFSRYFGRLSIACSLNFAQASVVYGMLAVLSVMILPTVKVAPKEMPFFYLVGNIASLAGSLLAAFLIDSWGRKGTVLLGYVLTTLGVACLGLAHTRPAVLFVYSWVMFSVIWASNTAYIVTSEILPVRNRATGLGISVAAGRIGAFIAPILLSGIFERTGNSALAVGMLALMTLPGPIAAAIWYTKGIEAKNCALDEIAGELGLKRRSYVVPELARPEGGGFSAPS